MAFQVISISFHPDGDRLAAAAGQHLYVWSYRDTTPTPADDDDFRAATSNPRIVLQTQVSLRCVRFLDERRILVGMRSRTTQVGVTSYIRAARAHLYLYAYDQAAIDQNKYLERRVLIVKRALLYNDVSPKCSNSQRPG